MEKVKMTNGEVKMLKAAIENFQNAKPKLPVKVWYSLSKSKNRLNVLDKDIEDTRLQLVEKYGEKGDKGIVQVPEKNMQKFLDEYQKILKEEVEVELHKVNIKEFDDEKLEGIDGLLTIMEYLIVE